MSLSILCGAVDLFGKLKRDAEALDEEVSADRFFNFVVTGYSLIAWVRHDTTLSATAKSEVCTLRKDHWIKVCGDLSTAAKHFELTDRKPITESTEMQTGYGSGRYGKGGYGIGEPTINVILKDGTIYDCLELKAGVIASWEQFFQDYHIS